VSVDTLEFLRTENPVPHGSTAPPMEWVLAQVEHAEPQPAARRRIAFALVPTVAVAATLVVVAVVIVLAVTHRGQAPAHLPPATHTTVPSPQSLMPSGGMHGALVIQGAASPSSDDILVNFSQCPACRAGAAVDPSRFWQALTADGGRSWHIARTPLDLAMFGIGGADAWAQGAGSDRMLRFFASHDGGRSWHVAPSDDPAPGYGGVSIAGGEVWSLGNGCVGTHCADAVLRAPASGDRITQTVGQPPLGHSANVSVVAATRDSAYVLTGGTLGSADVRLFATHDGGRTWQRVAPPCAPGSFGSLYGRASALWATCESRHDATELRRSTDDGQHWTTRSTMTGSYQLQVASARVAWAVESDGRVLRTSDSGRSWAQVWYSGRPEPAAPANAPPGLNRAWGMFLTVQSRTTATVIVQVSAGRPARTDFVTYRTTDGGRTWSPSVVRLPAG
jgi:photosystem II stability/assembly factor-like uncharacterized protein